VTGGDRVASLVTGARMVLTSGTRLPERERAVARERGRVRLTGGPGWQRQRGGECGRAGDGLLGPRGGGRTRGRAGEREGLRGEFSFFFFLFLFLISISISFISFFF
jgi:hypothetical protein